MKYLKKIFYYINKVKRYSLLYKQIISNVSIIPLFKEILYDRIKNPEDVKNAFVLTSDPFGPGGGGGGGGCKLFTCICISLFFES